MEKRRKAIIERLGLSLDTLPNVIVTGLIQLVAAGLAVAIVGRAIKNSWVHDIGIILILLCLVLSIPFIYTRRSSTGGSLGPQPLLVPFDSFLQGVTGETTIGEVTDSSYPPVDYIQSWEMQDLKLAHMALLRRLAIRKGLTASRSDGEAVLTAAGIEDRASSLVQLRGLELIEAAEYVQITLTARGINFVEQFTSWLTYDPRLVAAYRRVALRIDQTIRLDGRALVQRFAELPGWTHGTMGQR